MILNREKLEDMTVKQLLALSYETGTVIDNPAAGKEHIIKQLLLHAAQENIPKPEVNEPTAPKQSESQSTTIEQLKDALNPFILRGMKLFHNKEDATWLIRIKLKNIRIRDSLTGDEKFVERWKDDSGTMNQPLSTIKRCARVLMQNVPSAAEVKEPVILMRNYEAVA